MCCSLEISKNVVTLLGERNFIDSVTNKPMLQGGEKEREREKEREKERERKRERKKACKACQNLRQ